MAEVSFPAGATGSIGRALRSGKISYEAETEVRFEKPQDAVGHESCRELRLKQLRSSTGHSAISGAPSGSLDSPQSMLSCCYSVEQGPTAEACLRVLVPASRQLTTKPPPKYAGSKVNNEEDSLSPPLGFQRAFKDL